MEDIAIAAVPSVASVPRVAGEILADEESVAAIGKSLAELEAGEVGATIDQVGAEFERRRSS